MEGQNRKHTLYTGCTKALQKSKSAGMDDKAWKLLNPDAFAHIYMEMSDEL